MHQRKSKKILIYFFLLIALGSINNTSINNLKFENIQNFNVSGLKNINKQNLILDLKNLDLGNIFFIKKNKINDVLDSNSLVQSFQIFKKYPSTLEINIKETKFLAKINQNGQTFIIGSNGKLSTNNFSSTELPYIFGKPDIKDFLKFKKIVDASKLSYEKIKYLYFYEVNRWDIEFENNVMLKLPKNLSVKSLNDIFVFLNDEKFKKIKIIDARINNQIIVND
tara:strand:- start:953 stop:1624 length:672 start_codon:yes stop_codon:yes gene_type:complete